MARRKSIFLASKFDPKTSEKEIRGWTLRKIDVILETLSSKKSLLVTKKWFHSLYSKIIALDKRL